jgi:hypothetical protein
MAEFWTLDPTTRFMTNEQANEIIKAQGKLLLHVTERIVMLQVAFEAYVHDQIGQSGPKYDAHYAHRKELFEQDFDDSTKSLLNTLKQAVDRADK